MPYPENRDIEIEFDPTNTDTFDGFIRNHRAGLANDLLTQVMEEVALAVDATGKDAGCTIKITVKKLPDGDTEKKVIIKVTKNIPVQEIPAGIYYNDDKGKFHRTDPRQMSLLDHKRQDGDINKVGRGGVIEMERAR